MHVHIFDLHILSCSLALLLPPSFLFLSWRRGGTTLHPTVVVRWPLQPLQSLQKTQRQPPVGPSVDSLCHPWFTTTNLSYRFHIFDLCILLVYLNYLPSYICISITFYDLVCIWKYLMSVRNSYSPPISAITGHARQVTLGYWLVALHAMRIRVWVCLKMGSCGMFWLVVWSCFVSNLPQLIQYPCTNVVVVDPLLLYLYLPFAQNSRSKAARKELCTGLVHEPLSLSIVGLLPWSWTLAKFGGYWCCKSKIALLDVCIL